MIDLNLQMFGGGGSGSGGGKKSTGATNAVSSSAPGRHGSAGGQRQAEEKRQESERKSISVGEPVKTISSNERYAIYDTKGRMIKSNISGAALNKEIANRKIRYNESYSRWIIKSSNRHVIIRRIKSR